jgi:hypothetical protein
LQPETTRIPSGLQNLGSLRLHPDPYSVADIEKLLACPQFSLKKSYFRTGSLSIAKSNRD